MSRAHHLPRFLSSRRLRALVLLVAGALAVTVLTGLSRSGAGGSSLEAAFATRPVAAKPDAGTCHPRRFRGLSLEGATITGVRASWTTSGVAEVTPPSGTEVPGPAFCEVEISLTHGQEGTAGLPSDDAHVWVWLPGKWNGRIQAVGGGGTKATYGAPSMVEPMRDGYAVVASDAGLSVEDPEYYIFLDGTTFNWQLFENWSWRSVHESAVLSKAVVRRRYGRPASYSYWNGCSNGGRQGLEMAQRFPEDFDGILAEAPAIYGARRLNMTMSWPAMVQNDAFGEFIPECVMSAFTDAVIAACDPDDGIVDGLVSRPELCGYAPALDSAVGRELPCGTVTQRQADVVKRIFEGPRTEEGRFVWYGHTPGVDLSGGAIANFDGWALQVFAKHDRTWDWRTATAEQLIEELQPQLAGRLEILAGADPVLEPYAERGGKLLMWHGLADGLFPADQSVHYRDEVAKLSGAETDDFFRLFLAPGVDHCGGGRGPAPEDPFRALVRWVERGDAPERLRAVQTDKNGTVVRERKLCPYPQVQVYDGEGDPDAASSFDCARPEDQPAAGAERDSEVIARSLGLPRE